MKNAMNLKAVGLLVLFSLISLWTYAQSLTVKGVVKDSNGESIIGANVLEKGTTNGTITDLDGNFTLKVSGKDAILQVSFVGFRSEEMPVGGKKNNLQHHLAGRFQSAGRGRRHRLW